MNPAYLNEGVFPPLPPSNYQSSSPQENLSFYEADISQAYIENLLKMNLKKLVTVYMTYTGSNEWRDKIHTGILEGVGRDNIIISDPSTGKWYLLPSIYLAYMEFNEALSLDVKPSYQNRFD